MNILKALFVRGRKLQRKIDIAIAIAVDKTKTECEIESRKKLIDQSHKYEKIIIQKENKISELIRQHKKDQRAYKKYKDNLERLNLMYENAFPIVEESMILFSRAYQNIIGEKGKIRGINYEYLKTKEKIEGIIGSAEFDEVIADDCNNVQESER